MSAPDAPNAPNVTGATGSAGADPAPFKRAVHTAADGRTFGFDDTDLAALGGPGLGWNAPGDPSSWLCCATVARGRAKFAPSLGRADIVRLCAATLGISEAALEQALDWNANYMAWHDGGSPDENHPYPTSAP